jgi:hypothetical protein
LRSVGAKLELVVGVAPGFWIPAVGDAVKEVARVLALSSVLVRVMMIEAGRVGLAVSAAFLLTAAGSVAVEVPGLGVVGFITEDGSDDLAVSDRNVVVTGGRKGSAMRPLFGTSVEVRDATNAGLGGSFGNVGRTRVNCVPSRSRRSLRCVGSLDSGAVRIATLGMSLRVTRATRSRPMPSLMTVLFLPTT